MTAEEYIQQNPYQFKDEIDKWLFGEFNIIGGACSAQESFRYSVAREVAGKAIEYTKEQMMAKAVDGKVIANGMGNPILHLWDKGRYLIGKKVKVIVIKED